MKKQNIDKPQNGGRQSTAKRSNGSKSRRKSTRDKKVCENANSTGDVGSHSLDNDPSWYNVYPELVDSTARISTGYPIGINYNIMGLSDRDWDFINDVHTMRLFYTHGIGLTTTDRDPVNLAATKLYSYVRHANSGHANYERTDLMLYFLSVIEAYNLIANAIRAYGTINMFNNMNRMMPKYVIEAIGWDYEDLVDNAALLRTRINNMIARVNSLYIPTELNVVKRWWWLNTTIFTDSAGPKAMNYVCTPEVYRVWEEMDAEKGGYLKAYSIPEKFTLSSWTQATTKVLNHILDSEDIGIMSGDILKAYGDRVFTLSMIDENYTTPFVYSEEVLTQINNTTVTARDLINTDITQVQSANLNSGLRYEPKVKLTQSEEDVIYRDVMMSTPVMSFSVNDPDNLMVMVASRNVAFIDDYDAEGGWAVFSSGSEIFTKEWIYRSGDHFSYSPSFAPLDESWRLNLHNRFDYSPIVKMFDTASGAVYVGCSHYENVIPVGERTVDRMHDTALLSLFSALV